MIIIKNSLPYERIGHKLLVNATKEELVEGIKREFSVKAYIVPSRGVIPTHVMEAESLYIEPVRYGVKGSIKTSELNKEPWMEEKIDEVLMNAISQLEDQQIFDLLEAAVKPEHTISVGCYLVPENLDFAISLLKSYNLPIGHIVMHPMSLENGPSGWSEYSEYEVNEDGTFYKKMPILTSVFLPKDTIYFLAKKEYLGVVKFEDNFEDTIEYVAEKDCKNYIKSGFFQAGILNDYAIVKIKRNAVIEEEDKTEVIKSSEIIESNLEPRQLSFKQKFGLWIMKLFHLN